MNRFTIILWPMLMLSVSAFSQHDKTTYYRAATYEYAGIELPYRELSLNQEAEGASVLVVQLHGGTARGTDNKAQLEASAVDSVETYLRVHQMKALFLLLQCSAERVWNESERSVSTPMTTVLGHWLHDYIDSHDVDASRVYITGYSAGGSGSWRMLNDYPDLFAAACIAAATPILVTAANVKSTPVYAIAGTDDSIMDADKIESFVGSLLLLGCDARFDLLEGSDHFATCDASFTRERLRWMFSHRRSATSLPVPVAQDNGGKSVHYDLCGRRVSADAAGLHIVRSARGKTAKVWVSR